MYLIFDTETTGFPIAMLPPEHSEQAHIVQLAALILDENFNEVGCMNTLIKPKGWIIPSEATAVHGKTMEMCSKYGIPILQALLIFNDIAKTCKYQIAHNLSFDSRMMDIECTANSVVETKLQKFCTMHATTDICKLPGKFGKYKWPKLAEVYYYLFNENFDKAHDALADVRACARVFKWLVENGKVPLNQPPVIC